ncbi:hypothetical protein TNCV_3742051 [Trichonephila clavipes]|nr:hypothetical protein TNCV_3742051 [Trichonephila clavipes]
MPGVKASLCKTFVNCLPWKFFQTQQQYHEQAEEPLPEYVVVFLMLSSDRCRWSVTALADLPDDRTTCLELIPKSGDHLHLVTIKRPPLETGQLQACHHCQVIYSQFGLAIHQNDHQARRRFVEWAQNEIAVVPDFHKRILFSDEAHFWLNGYVNKQNCRIWSEANPQVYVETPLHPEKLTGAVVPTRRRNMSHSSCHDDLLKDTFGDRLISRFGPMNWPPRSCDLTPLDYFLWGYVKSLVYADKPQTLDHLEDNIRRVIADIRPQMLEKVIEN